MNKQDKPNCGGHKKPEDRNTIRDYRRQDEQPVERTQNEYPEKRRKRRQDDKDL